MDAEAAIKIAKSKKSTPDELKKVIRISGEIDRLVAKNPNTTAQLLDELGTSLDEKIVAAVTEHPNISIELLESLGAFHPLSMFRNPALPTIMASTKNFLGGFYGDEFDAALKSKKVPEFVVDWLAAQGSFEHQALYLFGSSRTPGVVARFRNSKHAKIVGQILQRDDDTYLAWAQDLGFQMPAPEEGEPVAARFEVDLWVENLDSENTNRWKALVPAEGVANTLQGEMVRAIGRLQSEYFRNGMMNWGDGGGYYEGFTSLVHETLKAEASFTKLVKKMIEADVDEIKLAGKRGKAMASGKKSRESTFGDNFLIASDAEKSMQRLGALIAIWCQRHPDLIPYKG